MNRILLCLLASLQLASTARAADEVIKCPSPDGNFALQLVRGLPLGTSTATIIDAKSHFVLEERLDAVPTGHFESAKLVWAADSLHVAFGYQPEHSNSLKVFFWDGFKFADLPLPELPQPQFKESKPQVTSTKLVWDIVTPVRWLKPDTLLLTREWSSSYTYADGSKDGRTSTLTITLAFDLKQHAKVLKVVQEDAKK